MYVKLFTQILDSSIADDRRLRHFFTDILLCADPKGLVMMTEQAIARRIGADLDEVRWGLEQLSSPDPLSKTPDHEGRRLEKLDGVGYGWRVLNYEFYRDLKDADQMREATRERVRRFRLRQKGLPDPKDDGNACNAAGNAGNSTQSQTQPQTQTQPQKKKKKSEKVEDSDEVWLAKLEGDPIYVGLNIRQELGKMQQWCSVNNRKPSRKTFINWINRADRPIAVNGSAPKPKHAAFQQSDTTAGKTIEQQLNF